MRIIKKYNYLEMANISIFFIHNSENVIFFLYSVTLALRSNLIWILVHHHWFETIGLSNKQLKLNGMNDPITRFRVWKSRFKKICYTNDQQNQHQ